MKSIGQSFYDGMSCRQPDTCCIYLILERERGSHSQNISILYTWMKILLHGSAYNIHKLINELFLYKLENSLLLSNGTNK